jgi:hypothetical protein
LYAKKSIFIVSLNYIQQENNVGMQRNAEGTGYRVVIGGEGVSAASALWPESGLHLPFTASALS